MVLFEKLVAFTSLCRELLLDFGLWIKLSFVILAFFDFHKFWDKSIILVMNFPSRYYNFVWEINEKCTQSERLIKNIHVNALILLNQIFTYKILWFLLILNEFKNENTSNFTDKPWAPKIIWILVLKTL